MLLLPIFAYRPLVTAYIRLRIAVQTDAAASKYPCLRSVRRKEVYKHTVDRIQCLVLTL